MTCNSLDSILEGKRSQPQQLIEALQDVQEAYGYVSEEAMTRVSEELGVPLIEVSRVAHFYKAFSLKPKGRHELTICMGTACHVRGARKLLDEAFDELGLNSAGTTEDGSFTLESVNCLGACALGPIVVLDGEVHGQMTPGKLRSLIQSVRTMESEVADNA